jgi:nitrate reductase / nitrite oxidoreductase, alpha subunit
MACRRMSLAAASGAFLSPGTCTVPLRVKYPYIRGALLDLWTKARAEHERSRLMLGSRLSKIRTLARWQQARGKGGFRRVAMGRRPWTHRGKRIYTIKQRARPHRRLLSDSGHVDDQLRLGRALPAASRRRLMLSFYDWYCDLPSASPETGVSRPTWHESADWYNAKLLAVMGSNLNDDAHPRLPLRRRARHNGSKMWVFAPDFNQVPNTPTSGSPVNAGQDGAWWMAVNHVLLKEFHVTKSRRAVLPRLPAPLHRRAVSGRADISVSGTYRRAAAARRSPRDPYRDVENGDWKFLMWDETSERAQDAARQLERFPLGQRERQVESGT